MRRRDVVGQSKRISKGKGGSGGRDLGGNEKFVRAGRSREIKYFGRVILMVVSRIDGHGGRWCKLLFYCEGFEDTYRSAPFYTDFRNDFGGRPLLRFSISIFYENRNEWNGNFNFSEFFVSDSAIQKIRIVILILLETYGKRIGCN